MAHDSFSLTPEAALAELEAGLEEAQDMLEDPAQLKGMLRQLDEKMQASPVASKKFPVVVTLLGDLVKDYAAGRYTEIPEESVATVISALQYVIRTEDMIADTLRTVGYFDDCIVVRECVKLVEEELLDYKDWRRYRAQ